MSEQRYGDELEHAWDAIARGDAPVTDLDAWLVETLREVHARDHADVPDATFLHDLREELMLDRAISTTSPVSHLQMPNGRSAFVPAPTMRRVAPQSHRRSLGQFATAAIIVLALIGSFFAFGGGRLQRQAQAPVFLPAISGTPETLEPVQIETLLDATTGTLPKEAGIIVFKRLILQPSPKALVVLPLTGPVFVMVASGELTATTAGSERHLVAGDSFSPADPGQETALRATGPDEALVYLVYLQRGPDLPFPRDPTIHSLDVLINVATDASLECPCRLVLERYTVSPGNALGPQKADPLAWFALEKGELGLTLEGDRLPYTFESGQERTFSVGQYLPIDMVAPGTPMTLRNAGDAPLVLYRLTLVPGETGSPTAARPAAGAATRMG